MILYAIAYIQIQIGFVVNLCSTGKEESAMGGMNKLLMLFILKVYYLSNLHLMNKPATRNVGK